MARKTKNKPAKIKKTDARIDFYDENWDVDYSISGLTFRITNPIWLHRHEVTSFGAKWIWKTYSDTPDGGRLLWSSLCLPIPRVFTTPADAAADVCLNPLPEPFNERAPQGKGWTLYRS